MDNKLAPDSTMPIQPHLQAVNAAIEAEAGKSPAAAGNPGPGAAGGSGGVSIGVGEVAAIAAGSIFGPAIGAAVGVAAVAATELSGKSSFFQPDRKKRDSRFLQGSPAKPVQAVSLLPAGAMTYGEKRAAAKIGGKVMEGAAGKGVDVFARSRLAGMSLTGASGADKNLTPPKGVAVAPEAAKALGVSPDLVRELDVTLRARDNPYERGTKRLAEDLRQGVDAAENLVARKPDLAKAVTPGQNH